MITSSDSSNESESALEKDVYDECGDNDQPEEESNRSNSAHGENQLSIQRISALQPPGPYNIIIKSNLTSRSKLT